MMNTKTGYGIYLLLLSVALSGCAVGQIFAQRPPSTLGRRQQQNQTPPPDYTRSPFPANVCTPQIRGLSIGMTKEAFTKLLGFNYFIEERPIHYYPFYPAKVSRNLNYEGTSLNAMRAQALLYKAQHKTLPNYAELAAFPVPPLFEGVEVIDFSFQENRLVYIGIRYRQNFSKDGEFFEKVVNSFNLPRDGWQGAVKIGQIANPNSKTLICNGAAINLSYYSLDGPAEINIDGKLDLQNIMTREYDRIKEQERLDELRKRDTFKP